MNYKPTIWKDGDLVTSAKLNKIEQGIASHNIVEAIEDEETGIMTLNKTWQEIWDNNYMSIIMTSNYDGVLQKEFIPIVSIGSSENKQSYAVVVNFHDNTQFFTCDSSDSYPSGKGFSGEQDDSSGNVNE